jgi:D-amino-acid oxidase
MLLDDGYIWHMKKKITVAGCGVIGLTTAVLLQEDGYEVMIVTRDLPKQTTSNKAAAFWFPYHVRDSREILQWSMASYEKFEALSKAGESGVSMIPVFKLGNEITEIEQRIKETLPEGRFRPLTADELRGNFESGWHIEVPLIETPIYLPYLLNEFVKLGGKIAEHEIESLDELLQRILL